MNTPPHIHVCTHKHNIHKHTHTYRQTDRHMYTHMYGLHVCVYMCMYVCMYVCECAYVHAGEGNWWNCGQMLVTGKS